MRNYFSKVLICMLLLLIAVASLGVFAEEDVVQLPKDLKVIKDNAFGGTESITKVIAPEGMESIGEGAFSGSGLTEITLPGSVVEIADNAFSETQNDVTILAAEDSYAKEYADKHEISWKSPETEFAPQFKTIRLDNGTICIMGIEGEVPNKLVIPEKINGTEVTTIGASAFMFYDDLITVVIPDTVKKIYDYAFTGCHNLQSIELPKNITSLGDSLFLGCYRLKEIDIPEGVTEISANCFEMCSSLERVKLPSTFKKIGTHAFMSCKNLRTIELSNSITSIGNEAFLYCDRLVAIVNEGSYAHEYAKNNNIPCDTGLHSFELINVEPVRYTMPAGEKKPGGFFDNLSNVSTFNVPLGASCTFEAITYGGEGDVHYSYTLRKGSPKGEIVASSDGYVSENEFTYTFDNTGSYYMCANAKNGAIESVEKTSVVINVCGIENGWIYTHREGEVRIDKYNGVLEGDVVIPGTLNGESVKRIASDALREHYNITSLTIPDSVTNIGLYAFSELISLRNVTLSRSIRQIEDGTFYLCTSLTSIKIPEGVTHIDMAAFRECTSLTDIILPQTLEYIQEEAFLDCTALRNIIIPSNVNRIDAGAFKGCSRELTLYVSEGSYAHTFAEENNIEYVLHTETPGFTAVYEDGGMSIVGYRGAVPSDLIIPSEIDGIKVKSIAASAFRNNNDIVCVTIPDTVETIGSYAFSKCRSMEKVTLHSGLKRIEKNAFEYCSMLKSIALPDGVTYIGNRCFESCNSLADVTLSSTLVEMGNYPFANCRSLSSLAIPPSVSVIDTGISSGYDGLFVYHVEPGSYAEAFVKSMGLAYDNGLGDLLLLMPIPDKQTYPVGSICTWKIYTYGGIGNVEYSIVVLHNGVETEIKSSGYAPVESFTALLDKTGNITIRVCVWDESGQRQQIDAENIVYTYGIEDNFIYVEVDDGVSAGLNTSIAGELVFPKTLAGLPVTQIKGHALSMQYEISSVEIPYGIRRIEGYAFYDCTNLKKVIIPGSVTLIEENAFYRLPADFSLTVVENSYGHWYAQNYGIAYSTVEGAYELSFLTEKNADSSLTIKGISGFSTSALVIPSEYHGKTVTAIAEEAFFKNTDIESVIIPNSVTKIGGYAFYDCVNLKDVSLPDSLPEFPSFCFHGCKSLSYIALPSDVKTIGAYALYQTGIQTISLPDTVREIGHSAFRALDNLVSIRIPEGTETIDAFAFGECKNLESVYLPKSLTSIAGEIVWNSPKAVLMVPDGSYAEDYAVNNGISYDDGSGRLTIVSVTSNADEFRVGDKCVWTPYLYGGTGEKRLEYKLFRNGQETGIGSDGFVTDTEYSYVFDDVGEYHIVVTAEDDTEYSMQRSSKSVNVYAETDTLIYGQGFNALRIIGVKDDVMGEVVIPSAIDGQNVTEIYRSALHNNKSITSIIVQDGISTIWYSAFSSMPNLQSAVIGNGPIILSSSLFMYCSSLHTVTLSEGIKTIDRNCFEGCKALSNIALPNSLTSIGNYAFRDCTSLPGLLIPESVTSIGNNTFAGVSENFTLTVTEGSYAHQYAIDNGINYEFAK